MPNPYFYDPYATAGYSGIPADVGRVRVFFVGDSMTVPNTNTGDEAAGYPVYSWAMRGPENFLRHLLNETFATQYPDRPLIEDGAAQNPEWEGVFVARTGRTWTDSDADPDNDIASAWPVEGTPYVDNDALNIALIYAYRNDRADGATVAHFAARAATVCGLMRADGVLPIIITPLGFGAAIDPERFDFYELYRVGTRDLYLNNFASYGAIGVIDTGHLRHSPLGLFRAGTVTSLFEDGIHMPHPAKITFGDLNRFGLMRHLALGSYRTYAPINAVTVTPASGTSTPQTLTAHPVDSLARPLPGRKITWTCSPVGRATLTPQGTSGQTVAVTAGSSSGLATITATVEGHSGNATVTVP